MNATKMPGFTADASIYGAHEHFQAVKNQDYSRVHGVIAQMQIGQGARGSLGGFWLCAACIAGCTILIGDIVECTDACIASGACEPVVTALA